jgi:hypothetical protein
MSLPTSTGCWSGENTEATETNETTAYISTDDSNAAYDVRVEAVYETPESGGECGVDVDNGAFTMAGGEISGNTKYGVQHNHAYIYKTGGIVYGNPGYADAANTNVIGSFTGRPYTYGLAPDGNIAFQP